MENTFKYAPGSYVMTQVGIFKKVNEILKAYQKKWRMANKAVNMALNRHAIPGGAFKYVTALDISIYEYLIEKYTEEGSEERQIHENILEETKKNFSKAPKLLTILNYLLTPIIPIIELEDYRLLRN